MSIEQQTIGSEASFEGVGLHTGDTVRLRFIPAAAGTGIRFRRSDLDGKPEVPATLESVSATDRNTTLAVGEARVATVEHLLAAVTACEIDNLIIDIDAGEVPIGDGSFAPFFEVLRNAGLEKQGLPARVLELKEAVRAAGPAGATYVAVPDDSYRVATTIEFSHPLIRRQYGAYEVTCDEFASELSGARTFGFLKDAEALRERGLVKGVSFENAVILDEDGVASGELRWTDEFVRHKAGDVIGDLALIGRRLRAQVIANRPSHAGNVALARAIVQAASKSANGAPIVDINKIMQHLPHRYPMLLVDRIIDFEAGKRIVGIKNVTINEPFFQGHYPGHPIMPGVLIIEAMAQVGGLLIMDTIENIEDKVVYFMSMDGVKWRRPVTPGDQIRFEVEMLQVRRQVCRMRGIGYVDGQIASEAEFTAAIMDR
ncbi:MAG TPA: bifunctional UDP-3-O-[3-hydroxymyristoyl] N-acetylglucosamine deacetylase/3-hydroxyacyl-ACP dehydratase [Longimicrobiales bacterium]|nr:bifunctional UDP-3-O-[3-hydroxymyristoyl] N-acetylglucosamine deacetylase/3-hydroxyacyl-ACP dehydratase [Longimicrobiales bacterium]